MKLIYKPIGIVLGVIAGLIGKKVFEAVWGYIDEVEPPKPTTKHASLPKVLGAAAVEGIAFKLTRAAVDRAGARSFEHLTGVWPGEETPDPE